MEEKDRVKRECENKKEEIRTRDDKTTSEILREKRSKRVSLSTRAEISNLAAY
jgi:hypothetical protein